MTAAEKVRACANPACGQALTRRPGEGVFNWQRRKFCSRSCVILPGRPPIETGPRVCASPGCGALLVRRAGEKSGDWRARRYCSADCYRPRRTRSGPVLPVRRWCGAPGCGLELTQRVGECGADFRKRQFCGRDCSNQAAGKPRLAAPAAAAEIVQLDLGVGACFGRPDAFWTDTGRDDDELERLRGLAYRFCEGCPIRQGCKAYGRQIQFGLFGGELWREDRGTRVVLDLLVPVDEAVSA